MNILLGSPTQRSAPNQAWIVFGAAILTLTLAGLVGCSSPDARRAGELPPLRFAKANTNSLSGPTGPTLRLDYGRQETPANPIADFMYFVPLISPDPVSVIESPGNSQRARVAPAKRHFTAYTFSVTCEFEITGEGSQRNRFDNTASIRRNERKLKEGGAMNRVLDSITVEGAGFGSVEVEGMITNRVATVTEVRLRFNERGKPSPVTITLQDLRYIDGAVRPTNEVVARVNTLTFQRGQVPPRMGVSVASVKRKEAGDGLWQKFVGSMAGAAANLLIKPIRVDPTGHAAMLDFGRALVAGEPTFTFPRARNLKPGPAPKSADEKERPRTAAGPNAKRSSRPTGVTG